MMHCTNSFVIIIYVDTRKTPFCVYKVAHMGQIPQDGENGQNVAFFYFF